MFQSCIFPVPLPQPHLLCGTSQGSFCPYSSSMGTERTAQLSVLSIQSVLSNVLLLCIKQVAKATCKIRCQEDAFLWFPCCLSTQVLHIQGAAELVMGIEWKELLIPSVSAICAPCCWQRGQAAPAEPGDSIESCCVLLCE